MSSKKSRTEENIKSLFILFEEEMVKDWERPQKFWNSLAMQEIVKRGQTALKPIAKYLNKKPSVSTELIYAWTRLLSLIENSIDLGRTAPEDFYDLKGWLNWAEKFA